MNFIKRLFKGILMTATMLASMTLTSGQTGIAPNIRFLETDQTLPDGLWRIRLDGDILTIQKNTNASNNFSTATTAISIAANGDVTIPNDFFVTGSATVTVDTSVIGDLEVTGTIRGANSSSYALLNEASSDSNPTLIPNRASSTTGIGAVIGEGESLHVVIQGSNRVQFNSAQMVVAVDTVMNGRLDVLGDGTDQVTLLVRGGSGQTLDLLQVKVFPSVDVLTIGVDGAVEAGNASGWALLNEAATAINPTVAPNRLLLGTGISAVDNEGAGSFHIVVDDISRMLLSADTARITSLLTTTGALFVDGISDQIQMRVDAHSTQTSQILRVRNSSFATIFNINDDGSFSFPNAISNIGIGAAPTISEAMNIELFIEGPSDNSKLVGIRVENFVLGAAADIVWVAVASIEGAVEVTAAVTTMDVAQLVIGEPFLQISGAGSVTDESNLLIDRIGTSGDNTYGIKILAHISTPATAAIFIDGSSGDSNAILMQGSDSGTVDFKQFVDVSGVGARWAMQTRTGVSAYANALTVSATEVSLPAASSLDWGGDLKLFRDEPWALALRDGNNDNAFRIYNQFTDLNNYERLALYAGGTADFFIEAQTAGTGQDITLIRIINAGAGSVEFFMSELAGGLDYRLGVSRFDFRDDTIDLGGSTIFRPRNAFFSGQVSTGLNQTSPIDSFILDSPNLTGAGVRDSNSILWTGQGFDSSQHDVDWKAFVDVTANDGTGSIWTLQTRIDAAGFAERWALDDTGLQTITGTGSYEIFSDTGNNFTLNLPGIWMFGTTGNTPAVSNYVLASNGTTATILNTPTGGLIINRVQNANITLLSSSSFTVLPAGPHAFGGNTAASTRILLTGSFTSDGSTGESELVRVDGTLTGALGDEDRLTGLQVSPSIVTQGVGEEIALISGLHIEVKSIIDSGDDIDNTAILAISGGVSGGDAGNFSIFVQSTQPVAMAGPQFAWGILTVSDNIQFDINEGIFTSAGQSDFSTILSVRSGLRGAPGDTNFLTGSHFTTSITTQTAVESISNISQAQFDEPSITDVNLTGSITNAQTILITGAPTEGVNNFALRVVSGDVLLGGNLTVSGAGPHAISGAAFGAVQLIISDTFTSDGSSTLAAGLFHTPTIVGAAGDTTSLTGTFLTAAITTQTATESIANISQLQINEPFITDNLTGSITDAQSLLITGAPTEGVTNNALRIVSGTAEFPDGAISTPSIHFSDTQVGFTATGLGIGFNVDGDSIMFVSRSGVPVQRVNLSSAAILTWVSGAAQGGGAQFGLSRVGADADGASVGDLELANTHFSVYRSKTANTVYHRTSTRFKEETLSSVSGASVPTTVNIIPSGAIVLGVTTEITSALGTGNGTTGYEVGDGTDADRWGSITGTSTATFSDNADFTNSAIEAFVGGPSEVTITALGGDFDGTGDILVVVHWIEIGARK